MSINLNMKKIGLIIVILLVVICVGYNRYSTIDSRKADAEYETLLKIANRQAVEIAIIEQQSKLLGYKQQMQTATQKVATE